VLWRLELRQGGSVEGARPRLDDPLNENGVRERCNKPRQKQQCRQARQALQRRSATPRNPLSRRAPRLAETFGRGPGECARARNRMAVCDRSASSSSTAEEFLGWRANEGNGIFTEGVNDGRMFSAQSSELSLVYLGDREVVARPPVHISSQPIELFAP